MNWLVIAGALFLAWNIILGYRAGLLRVVYSLGKWVLVLMVLIMLTPTIATFLTNYTSLHSKLTEKVEVRIEKRINEKIEEKADEKEQELAALGMQLPDQVVSKIPSLARIAEHSLIETGAYTSLAEEIAGLAVYGIAGLIVLVAALIACDLISRVFKLVDKLPGIHFVNHGLGVVAGVAKGIILIWLMLALLAVEVGTAVGQFFIPYIYEAPILQWLYENNLMLTVITAFF